MSRLDTCVTISRDDIRLNHQSHARLERYVWNAAGRRPAAASQNRRQIPTAVSVDEIVYDGKPGVLNQTGRFDDICSMCARSYHGGDCVERGLGDRVKFGEQCSRLRIYEECSQDLAGIAPRNRH